MHVVAVAIAAAAVVVVVVVVVVVAVVVVVCVWRASSYLIGFPLLMPLSRFTDQGQSPCHSPPRCHRSARALWRVLPHSVDHAWIPHTRGGDRNVGGV